MTLALTRPIAACLLAMGLAAWISGGPASAGDAADSAPCGTAAPANARTLHTLAINLFGHAETGWSFYAPLVTREIGTTCRPDEPGFAHALAAWQRKQGLPPSGAIDTATLLRMKTVWQARRPFVLARRRGLCPDAPDAAGLAKALPEESYGKTIMLLPRTLAAYRRLMRTARTQGIAVSGSPTLRIFSGYRSPDSDAARCAAQHNCDGVRRATCSNHRTGLAIDLYLGTAPGFAPDSTAPVNRAFIADTAAYRWLLNNARAFGFANYPYEPWHWEYTGTAR